MNALRCVLVDDLPHCTEDLVRQLAEHDDIVTVAGTASSVDEAVRVLSETKPDILFLDVELNPGTGFDILSQIKDQMPIIVFVSASDHYALPAIKASALDYLLKPVDPDELASVLLRCREKSYLQQQMEKVHLLLDEQKRSEPEFLVIPQQRQTMVIPISDIMAAEGESNYTRFYLSTGEKLLASMTIKDTEQVVGLNRFVRCHKSWLVNLRNVKGVRNAKQPLIILGESPQMEVPISRRRHSEVMSIIRKFKG